MSASTNKLDNLKITPTKRRRQPTQSRDISSTRTPTRTRTRIDSWRGSLRSPSQQSTSSMANGSSVAKSTPTTAASVVTASATTSARTNFQAVAGVLSYVVTLPEMSLPDKLKRRESSNTIRSEQDTRPANAAPTLTMDEEPLTPDPEPTLVSTLPAISISPSPKPMLISEDDAPKPIPIPIHSPRARRRRRSSISRSSSRSSSHSPRNSRLSSPPTYSAPLLDPPPAFMNTQDLENLEEREVRSYFDSESTPPPMAAINPPDESLDSPPPFSSTSFPPPNQDINVHIPTNDLPQEERQEQTTWWNYVSWSSSTKGGSGSNDGANVGPSNPSSPPPPPLVPFPLTVPQTTMTTAAVGLSLLNNIHTATDTDAPGDISSKPDDTNTIDTPTTMGVHKSSGEGWYAYVPVPWSWGSSSSGDRMDVVGGEGEMPSTASDLVAMVDGEGRGVEATNVDSEPDSNSQPPEPEPPSSEVSNPLTASFQKDTLTWASFLRTSRRLLNVKRLTDSATDEVVKTDENGVEVMDIDFEEEAQGGGDDSKPEGGGKEGLPVFFVSDGDEIKGEMNGSNVNTKTDSVNPNLASGSSSAGLASRIWTSTATATSTSTTTTSTTTTTNHLSRSPIISRPASRTAMDSQTQTPPSRAPTPLKRHASPAPSKRSISSKSKAPNMVVPKWEETFLSAPRSVVSVGERRMASRASRRMRRGMSLSGSLSGSEGDGVERAMMARGAGGEEGIGGKILGRTVKFVSGLLGGAAGAEAKDGDGVGVGVQDEGVTTEIERRLGGFGQELPKAWKVLEDVNGNGLDAGVLRGCKKVVVIGVHGWFPGTFVRTVMGEPTGTSTKFASMMGSALEEFEREYGVEFEKVTLVPLEGEGTIEKRVDKLYANLLSNPEWTKELHECDALFFAAHSQGCIVSTHLLDRLLVDGHVVTHPHPNSNGYMHGVEKKYQRVCILALCGIHLGPLRYLSSSTLVGPYLQYFESVAARELFEFQNTESQVSKNYVRALGNVLDHGIKLVYIASLNDQVVPMYSGLFTAASHPLILRALYIDGDAYSSSDFLSNLLTLLIRVINSGLSDSGLLAHLSEATAGSLNGVGHSTVYEEMGNYTLAVKYLFLANEGGTESGAKLRVEPFNALMEQNDYEIPWSLRDLIAHPLTSFLFAYEIEALREAFKAWHPKTTSLRELRRKVAPLGRGLSAAGSGSGGATVGVVSKL